MMSPEQIADALEAERLLKEEKMIDHFAKERETLTKVLEVLGDPTAVTLHEMAAENVFGDPTLRPAMLYVMQAADACAIAGTLVRHALENLPSPQDKDPEIGAQCVTHRGTFQGSYSPDDLSPICSQVDEGFEPLGDCKFEEEA